jgi:hypothetical protein
MIRCLLEEAAKDVTDEQWAVLEPVLGAMPRRTDGRGRPWRDSRQVHERQPVDPAHRRPVALVAGGVAAVPACHRRFQRWVRDGTLERLLETVARDRKARGKLDLSESFIDGTFIVAKKGGMCGAD